MMNILQIAAVLATIALVNGAYRNGVVRAKAVILPNCKQVPPYKVTGTVQITQKVGGGPTYFRVHLEGFPPKTSHGFHVHVSGDIHTQGCKSARGHYNPFGNTHGGPEDIKRHVGDLGNVFADAQGKVSVTIVDTKAGLVGENSIAGRAFVVHALRDDLGRGVGAQRKESLKTGNAGARVACGVIVYK